MKWTEHPDRADARQLRTFLDEHPRDAKEAFIICRCARPLRLDDRILALPWWAP